jgi:hypothetical protein
MFAWRALLVAHAAAGLVFALLLFRTHPGHSVTCGRNTRPEDGTPNVS